MKMFCVYDKKAGFYLKLFTETSTVQALRGFDQAVNDATSPLQKYPDDFELHELGTFDEHTGNIVQNISSLGSARTVLRQAELPGISRQQNLPNIQ